MIWTLCFGDAHIKSWNVENTSALRAGNTDLQYQTTKSNDNIVEEVWIFLIMHRILFRGTLLQLRQHLRCKALSAIYPTSSRPPRSWQTPQTSQLCMYGSSPLFFFRRPSNNAMQETHSHNSLQHISRVLLPESQPISARALHTDLEQEDLASVGIVLVSQQLYRDFFMHNTYQVGIPAVFTSWNSQEHLYIEDNKYLSTISNHYEIKC